MIGKNSLDARALSPRRPRDQRGFSLLEVLIAIVVLSIGLLGVAAMQTVGLRSSHGAYLSSQAAVLAYDIADRIRANAANAATYVGGSACPDPMPTTPLAAADVAAWSCALAQRLPAGSGDIESPAANQYRIRIEWADTQAEEDAAWNYELTVQL